MLCQIARDLPTVSAGTLWPPASTPKAGPGAYVPNLHEYDLIVIRISGGKDSQAAMRETWRVVVEQGIDPACVLVAATARSGRALRVGIVY